jgi:hypothetical protein
VVSPNDERVAGGAGEKVELGARRSANRGVHHHHGFYLSSLLDEPPRSGSRYRFASPVRTIVRREGRHGRVSHDTSCGKAFYWRSTGGAASIGGRRACCCPRPRAETPM